MPYPAFPKFTRQSLSDRAKRPLCEICSSLADLRIQHEPAAWSSEPFDLCSCHARQLGYVNPIPGRLVTSFDGLPMSTAQHDAHVRVALDKADFESGADGWRVLPAARYANAA